MIFTILRYRFVPSPLKSDVPTNKTDTTLILITISNKQQQTQATNTINCSATSNRYYMIITTPTYTFSSYLIRKIVSAHLVVSGNKETRDLFCKTSTRLAETPVSVQSHKAGRVETRVWNKNHAYRFISYTCLNRQPQAQVNPDNRFSSKPLKQVNENIRFHLARQPTAC